MKRKGALVDGCDLIYFWKKLWFPEAVILVPYPHRFLGSVLVSVKLTCWETAPYQTIDDSLQTYLNPLQIYTSIDDLTCTACLWYIDISLLHFILTDTNLIELTVWNNMRKSKTVSTKKSDNKKSWNKSCGMTPFSHVSVDLCDFPGKVVIFMTYLK